MSFARQRKDSGAVLKQKFEQVSLHQIVREAVRCYSAWIFGAHELMNSTMSVRGIKLKAGREYPSC